ncbi:MAG: DUF4342 domain-containing protein [Anaerolineae bacterium]|nr:DUF4342 domain-containing protein [Anaerolineae bacterium]
MSEKNEVVVEQPEPETTGKEKVRVEEFTLSGSEVVDKIKALIRQGNIRRITLKTDSNTILLDLPLTVGLAGLVVGTIVAPALTVIAGLAAVVAKWHITLEKVETA